MYGPPANIHFLHKFSLVLSSGVHVADLGTHVRQEKKTDMGIKALVLGVFGTPMMIN
jgi:hypothetical protein